MCVIEPWMYVAWFMIILVIITLVIYALRPTCLIQSNQHINTIKVIFIASFISVMIILLMSSIHNYSSC